MSQPWGSSARRPNRRARSSSPTASGCTHRWCARGSRGSRPAPGAAVARMCTATLLTWSPRPKNTTCPTTVPAVSFRVAVTSGRVALADDVLTASATPAVAMASTPRSPRRLVDLFMVVPPGPAAAFVRCHQYRRANRLSRVTAMSVRSNAVRCDHDRHGRPDRGPVRPVGGQQGALDAPVEGALRRGHHLRALHRVRRLRDRVPARRHRLRARAGRLQAVPPRGGARARQLHPRREGLHVVHPGLPPVPQPGSRRPTSTSSPACRQPDEPSGIYQDILLTRASDDMVHQIGQDGGLRVGAAHLGARPRLHRRRPHLLPRGRRRRTGTSSWKAIPGVATNKEEVLAGAGSRYTYSANTLALHEALERGLHRSSRSSA